MRAIKLFSVLAVLTFLMSSCFLFKKKHERCPAYGGENIEQLKEKAPLKADELEKDEETA